MIGRWLDRHGGACVVGADAVPFGPGEVHRWGRARIGGADVPVAVLGDAAGPVVAVPAAAQAREQDEALCAAVAAALPEPRPADVPPHDSFLWLPPVGRLPAVHVAHAKGGYAYGLAGDPRAHVRRAAGDVRRHVAAWWAACEALGYGPGGVVWPFPPGDPVPGGRDDGLTIGGDRGD